MDITRYTGMINFGTDTWCAISRRFDFVGDGHILINWHSPDKEPDYYQFLGVAQRKPDDSYVTPWVFLTSKEGEHLCDELMAKIDFKIVENTSGEMKIEGFWTDYQGKCFPLKATLFRSQIEA